MTRIKRPTESSRQPEPERPAGEHRPERHDPQQVETGVRPTVSGAAPTGEEAYGDERDQHRRTGAEEVEPER